jgi:hypothetical protein
VRLRPANPALHQSGCVGTPWRGLQWFGTIDFPAPHGEVLPAAGLDDASAGPFIAPA